MGIVVNAIDTGISGTGDFVRRSMTDMLLRHEGEHTIRIASPNRAGARLALNGAASISRETGKPIQKMRMYGHGENGVQGMGRGNWSQCTDRDASHTFDAISFANVDSLYPEIARLGQCFAEDGVLEFHACSVGGGTRGDQLLRKMARHLGRNVFAGIPLQRSMGETTVPGQRGLRQRWVTNFEGNVKGATPDGRVSYWVAMGGRYVRL